jgi:hypothetical protein
MKLKTLFITVIVLAVISSVVLYTTNKNEDSSPDAKIEQPVLSQSLAEKTNTIKISDQGKTATLTLNPHNIWVVSSYYDFPADFSKLSSFIKELTSAKIQRLVTSNPERLQRLDFKDTKIELFDASNSLLLALDLGKNADQGGRFLRFNSEQKAYLANIASWLDSDSKNWALSQLINDKPESISNIEILFNSGASISLSRTKSDSAWRTSENTHKTINEEKVSSLLSMITSLRFSDTVQSGSDLATESKKSALSIHLKTFSGKSITALLGRKPEIKILKPVKSGTGITQNSKTSPKSPEPEYDTTPAGPVFVWLSTSESTDSINSLSKTRDFQVDDYTYTSLPQKPEDLLMSSPTK